MLRDKFVEYPQSFIFQEILDKLQEHDEVNLKELARPDKAIELKR